MVGGVKDATCECVVRSASQSAGRSSFPFKERESVTHQRLSACCTHPDMEGPVKGVAGVFFEDVSGSHSQGMGIAPWGGESNTSGNAEGDGRSF